MTPVRGSASQDKLFQQELTPLRSNRYVFDQRESSMPLCLKCFHQQTGEVRSLKLNTSRSEMITFSEAVDLIRKEFMFDPQNAVITIRALDEEGNFSVIRTQAEFEDTIACAKRKKLNKKPNSTKYYPQSTISLTIQIHLTIICL